MANFIATNLKGSPIKVLINLDAITHVREDQNTTVVYFGKENSVNVEMSAHDIADKAGGIAV